MPYFINRHAGPSRTYLRSLEEKLRITRCISVTMRFKHLRSVRTEEIINEMAKAILVNWNVLNVQSRRNSENVCFI